MGRITIIFFSSRLFFRRLTPLFKQIQGFPRGVEEPAAFVTSIVREYCQLHCHGDVIVLFIFLSIRVSRRSFSPLCFNDIGSLI